MLYQSRTLAAVLFAPSQLYTCTLLHNTTPLSSSKWGRLQWIDNIDSRISMPGGQAVSPPTLGRSLPNMLMNLRQKLESVGYPAVKTASSYVHPVWHNTGVWRT